MTITTLTFAFKSTQNQWLGKLLDCTDPLNPVTHDLTGFTKVYIIFKKPDGTQTPTDAQMLAGFDQGAVLETPGTPSDSNIKFSNLTLPSILDQRGFWQYVPAALINNSLIKSPFTVGFWVP
ncbi:MAG: hypothetical protein IIC67_07435 [Thaumarchaeota archaeon]|nr:hypothetical protein [Nitrososphaerota archaeon]